MLCSGVRHLMPISAEICQADRTTCRHLPVTLHIRTCRICRMVRAFDPSGLKEAAESDSAVRYRRVFGFICGLSRIACARRAADTPGELSRRRCALDETGLKPVLSVDKSGRSARGRFGSRIASGEPRPSTRCSRVGAISNCAGARCWIGCALRAGRSCLARSGRALSPGRRRSGRVGPATGALAGVDRPEVAAVRALQVDQRALIAQ
jgi:hypothetical protein